MSEWHGSAVVYGPPASQGSKRIGRAGKAGKAILIENDRALPGWRCQMQDEMRKTAPPAPLDQPVAVRLTVYVRRPRAHYRANGSLKPGAPEYAGAGKDLDKTARATGDAGTGIWWRDDARIARWEIVRRYVGMTDGERTVVQAEVLGKGEVD